MNSIPELLSPLTAFERRELPIRLLDASGVPVTGVTFDASNMAVSLRGPTDSTFTAFVLATANWEEIGSGWYHLIMRGSVTAEQPFFRRTGRLILRVTCDAGDGVSYFELLPQRRANLLDLEPIAAVRPWRPYFGNPLFDIAHLTAQGAPTGNNIYPGKVKSVWLEGATYHAWVICKTNAGVAGLYHFTSSDGLDWTYDAGGARFVGAAAPSWENGAASMNNIWYDSNDSTWHMTYRGGTNSGAYLYAVGHATSADGLTWTRDAGNPIIEGSTDESDWDYGGIENCAGGIYYDGTYYNYYSTYGSGSAMASHVAASGLSVPAYRRIGVATAEDPAGPWTRQPGPLFGSAFGSSVFAVTDSGTGQIWFYMVMSRYQRNGDGARLELWSSPSPLFPPENRRFERVIHTADWGIAANDVDTISFLHDDMERTSFPSNRIMVYCTGSNDRWGAETVTGNRTFLLVAGGSSGLVRSDVAGVLDRVPQYDWARRTVEDITVDANGRTTDANIIYRDANGAPLEGLSVGADYTGNSSTPDEFGEGV